jgi:putative transposase
MRSRAALQLEIRALRHQLHVLQRSRRPRLHLTRADRLLWVWLLRIVRPDTVIVWHRRAFRDIGRGKVVTASVGRPYQPRSAR